MRLKKKFENMFKFSNNDINKFIWLLRESVYPYKYMDDWDKFNKTLLSDKKAFYSELYLENITNEDYIHAEKVFEESKLKNQIEYHDLHLRSDLLLLAYVFENFRKMCLEIYELFPAKYISALGLAW